LLTEPRMLFVPALRSNRGADFDPRKIPDHRDTPKIIMLSRDHNDRDRVTVVVVRKQNLIEDSLDRLIRLLSLRHANRITRAARRVQLATREASTESAGPLQSAQKVQRVAPRCRRVQNP
jgi:hypothetical protein